MPAIKLVARLIALVALGTLPFWGPTGCASHAAHTHHPSRTRFDFALIGDMPYTEEQATNAFPNTIAEINRHRLAFIVHDGDIKSGSAPCTDALFQMRYDQFQTFKHPFVLVFGDNEWTDCGDTNKIKQGRPADPMERLEALRGLFCRGDRSLGRHTMTLERQSAQPAFAAFRENVRWTYGPVLFVGLNIPGSGNHVKHPAFAERNLANLAWTRQSFELARKRNLRAVMLIIQANPWFELPSEDPLRRGFNDFLDVLEEETVRFKKPVVLVHGDSHYFRIDKPLIGSTSRRRLENFTRVETFGNPDMHWVKATVDARDPNVFSFRQQIVEPNLVHHQDAR